MTSKKEISRERWIRRDLRQALIHECGHSIIAGHFGDDTSHVQIFLRDDADLDNETLVGGRCRHAMLRGRRLQIMGVAGMVAETLSSDEYFEVLELIDFIEIGTIEMSATDACAAGHITEDLIDECASILRPHWSGLIAMAIHVANMFRRSYPDDPDVALAASAALVDLEGMRDRFKVMEAA